MNKPAGVIVISILYFLGVAMSLLSVLISIARGEFLAAILNQRGDASSGLSVIVAALGATLGVFFILSAATEALVGWGLWKLKNWARIMAIVFSGLDACIRLFELFRFFSIFSIINLVVMLGMLALDAWVILYLLKPEIKAAFQGRQVRALSV